MKALLKSFVFSLVFCLLGCSQTDKLNETRTQKEFKIVTLAPSLTECVSFLDPNLKQLSACTTYDTSFLYNDVTKFNIYPLEIENVLAAKPDCVLALYGLTDIATLAKLEANKIPFYLQKATSFPEMIESLKQMALFIGDTNFSIPRIYRLSREYNKLKNTCQPVKVLCILSAQPIYAFGTGSYFDEIITHLTGENNSLPINISNSYPQLNPEIILEINPDIIFFTNSASKTQFFEQIPLLKKINAYKSENLYVLDENQISRLSPNMYLAVKDIQEYITEFHINNSLKNRNP